MIINADQKILMNKEFLSLTISANILKYKTFFLKNSFVSFATLILMIIDKYLIIFIHLSTITKIALYKIFLRLLENKSIIKFMKISFHNTLNINKEFSSL